MEVHQKLWGRELWHHNDRFYCMKTLELRAGAVSSLHVHQTKRETFLVVSGEIEMEYSGGKFVMREGDAIDIQPRVAHRFRAIGGDARVVEASTYHDEDDVVRIEPSRLL